MGLTVAWKQNDHNLFGICSLDRLHHLYFLCRCPWTIIATLIQQIAAEAAAVTQPSFISSFSSASFQVSFPIPRSLDSGSQSGKQGSRENDQQHFSLFLQRRRSTLHDGAITGGDP
jgi:hypothetical protein